MLSILAVAATLLVPQSLAPNERQLLAMPDAAKASAQMLTAGYRNDVVMVSGDLHRRGSRYYTCGTMMVGSQPQRFVAPLGGRGDSGLREFAFGTPNRPDPLFIAYHDEKCSPESKLGSFAW